MVKGQRFLTKFVQSLIAALMTVLVFSGATVFAAQTNLPDGFIIGDSDGIHVEADGEYMIYVDNLTPGEIITKTLTIRNLERGKTPFLLSMTAEPGQASGPVNLLDIITLTVTMDGKTLYHGRLRGDEGVDMIQNALQLGTYKEGDSKTMQLKFEVGSFDPSDGKSAADVAWQFYAVKDETAVPPKTGEIITYTLYALGGLILITAVILFFLLKKRQKEEQQAAATQGQTS